MSYFAKVSNKKVVRVISADETFFEKFIDNEPGEWLQTSYNTMGGIHYDPETNEPSADQSKAFRKNYAGVGYTYDETRDAFIPPKPFESWTLNEETCLWDPPIKEPLDGKKYIWNEQTQTWDLVIDEQSR